MGVLELGEVAGKFHLQFRRRSRVTKTLQQRHEVLEKAEPARRFLSGILGRRLIVFALDQLAAGRNAHPAEEALGLAHLDSFRRKINVSPKAFQLGLCDLAFDGRKRDGEIAVANVERIEERLVMEKRRIIDIKRDLTHYCERSFALLVVINADVTRDQAAERIEREPAD